ncbi:phosphatase PAP2/dual specificity phosphatase family protein [Pseudomonas sp. LTJR-52]|uniref:phosphatase PAP2/dual specificity phosphatase family protein n=1 Tax=Pseudomonas sp. LTJR-52 TaxID=2479392 RepID=UPI0026BC94AF
MQTMLSPDQPLGLFQRARLGILWLAVLGPLFFLTYGAANTFTATRGDIGSLVFEWEHLIPFWSWTIIPYWSIDLLYGVSFLLCKTPREMKRHAFRLLTAQGLAIGGFLLFPLQFTHGRPETEGLTGWLFDVLLGFDQPYNQAPSLHIILLVILWDRYAAHSRPPVRWFVHGWALLIGLSVLTTYQHHFIDIPTGVLVGMLCLWCWPMEQPCPLFRIKWPCNRKTGLIGLCYLLGALAVAAIAVALGGTGLWLLWLGWALLLVSANYLFWGAQGFQKQSSGQLSIACSLMLAPYLLAAWANSRLWTSREPVAVEIEHDVWLGRLPDSGVLQQHGFAALVDLCGELPAPQPGPKTTYLALPHLDLVPLNTSECEAAARAIQQARGRGRTLVYCSLGYSRSAAAVAAWLILFRHVSDGQAARAQLESKRRVHLGKAQLEYLDALITHSPASQPAPLNGLSGAPA